MEFKARSIVFKGTISPTIYAQAANDQPPFASSEKTHLRIFMNAISLVVECLVCVRAAKGRGLC